MQLNLQTNLITPLKFNIPTATKMDYQISNGRLIWANPNIYLQSSGTQYIDTGVYGSGNTTVEVKYDMSATTNSAIFFGSRYAYHNKSLCIFAPYSNRFDYGNSSVEDMPSSAKFITSISNGNYFIKTYSLSDGSVQKENYTSIQTFTTPDTLKLFTGSTNGTISAYASAKVYYLKIYEEEVLVRHLVPVPTDLVIGNFTCTSNGMFDIVEQKFYANEGTENFTYGK